MSEALPNPFETARRRTDVITVALKADDLAPDLVHGDAIRLFAQHGAVIASVMLKAGVKAAIDLRRKE